MSRGNIACTATVKPYPMPMPIITLVTSTGWENSANECCTRLGAAENNGILISPLAVVFDPEGTRFVAALTIRCSTLVDTLVKKRITPQPVLDD